MRAALVGAAVFVIAGASAGGARQAGALRRPWFRVSAAVAQGHVDLQRAAGQRDGPSPNPFTDYRMTVVFTHDSGASRYEVPGYLPPMAMPRTPRQPPATSGAFMSRLTNRSLELAASMVSDRALRSRRTPAGRPSRRWTAPPIVRRHRVEQDRPIFARKAGCGAWASTTSLRGSASKLLKAGPDSPETLLAYEDFDNTRRSRRRSTPRAARQDWKNGDPRGQTKGKR